MKKIKVSEASGIVLDWLVAKCEGGFDLHKRVDWHNKPWAFFFRDDEDPERVDKLCLNEYEPSTDWAYGGPIIEENKIIVFKVDDDYGVDEKGYTTGLRIPRWGSAFNQVLCDDMSYNRYGESYVKVYEIEASDVVYGPTPLIAAMRCYVASKLGEEVEIPEELA